MDRIFKYAIAAMVSAALSASCDTAIPDDILPDDPMNGETPESLSDGIDYNVRINEICATDEEPYFKFIELYNDSDERANVSGWTLYKGGRKGDKCRWMGPRDTYIEPHGYLVLRCEADKASYDYSKEFGAGISSKKNIKIVLRDGHGNDKSLFLRGKAMVGWGEVGMPQDKRYSFARVMGEWKYAVPTPGEENGAAKKDISHDMFTVVINELCSASKTLELYNFGEEDVDLNGFAIFKDGSTSKAKNIVWQPTSSFIVEKGQYRLLYFDNSETYEGPDTYIASKFYGGRNVKIVLVAPDGNEWTDFRRGTNEQPDANGALIPWGLGQMKLASKYSYSRIPDGCDNWVYALPSEGASNGETAEGDIPQEILNTI